MVSLIYGGIAAVLDNEMAMVTLPAGMAGKDTLVDMFRENVANELAYNIGALIGDIFSIIEGLGKVISGITGAAAGAALAAQSGGATITVSGSGLALAADGMLITISGAGNAAKIMISEATSHGGGKNEGDSETGESLWKPTENKNNLWNKGKLKKHYDKHGDDFGAKSAQEYSDMAVEFGTRNSDDIVQTIHEGYVYRYEPSTNTVFVGTEKGGKVKSFYVWDGRENDLVINTLRGLDLMP